MPGVVRIVRGENLPLRMGGLGFRRRLSGLESVGGDEDEGVVGTGWESSWRECLDIRFCVCCFWNFSGYILSALSLSG